MQSLIPYEIHRLIERVHSDNERVRRAATEKLGVIGEASAVPALIEVLERGEWQAAKALGQIGEHATEAVPALIKALSADYGPLRHRAAEALGKIGDAATVSALINALGDNHHRVRHRAAEALGRIGNPAAVPPLVRALDDDRFDYDDWKGRRVAGIRHGVIEALERIGTPEAIKALEAYNNRGIH